MLSQCYPCAFREKWMNSNHPAICCECAAIMLSPCYQYAIDVLWIFAAKLISTCYSHAIVMLSDMVWIRYNPPECTMTKLSMGSSLTCYSSAINMLQISHQHAIDVLLICYQPTMYLRRYPINMLSICHHHICQSCILELLWIFYRNAINMLPINCDITLWTVTILRLMGEE